MTTTEFSLSVLASLLATALWIVWTKLWKYIVEARLEEAGLKLLPLEESPNISGKWLMEVKSKDITRQALATIHQNGKVIKGDLLGQYRFRGYIHMGQVVGYFWSRDPKLVSSGTMTLKTSQGTTRLTGEWSVHSDIDRINTGKVIFTRT